MDEAVRTALEDELKEALRQREKLDVVISYLNERLGGQALPSSNEASPPEGSGIVNLSAEPAASVREGEFFGMSSPEATRRLLEKFGRTRPMKTDEIFAAITKGGVRIQNAGTLYRSLTRDRDFLRVGRGVWGLSEWYPASARRSTPQNGDDDGTPDSEVPSSVAAPDDESGEDTLL